MIRPSLTSPPASGISTGASIGAPIVQRKKPRNRGVKFSLAEAQSGITGEMVAERRAEQVEARQQRIDGRRAARQRKSAAKISNIARLGLAEKRVYGHEPTAAAHPEETAAVEAAIGAEKHLRRIRKFHIQQGLLNSPNQDDFEARMERYEFGLGNTQVTNEKLERRLAEQGYRLQYDAGAMQARVMRGDRHVHTLHSGASAFVAGPPTALGRGTFTKRGAVDEQGAPTKTYVADDYGVPTRRYAYAVKSGAQLGILHGTGVLTGRHQALRHTKAPNMRPLPFDTEEATAGELQDLGINPARPLTDPEILYLHQEFGSSDRQRGVSLASTPKPLLSNAGHGFANRKVAARGRMPEHYGGDATAMKLTVDLERVPARNAMDPAPVLANYYHQIPGFQARFQAPALYNADGTVRYDTQRNERHLNWSVRKNRELFLRQLTPNMVAGSNAPSPEEYFVNPEEQEKIAAGHRAETEYQRQRQLRAQAAREAAMRGHVDSKEQEEL